VALEQPAHRRADPRRDVHAVGDVPDRHLVHGAPGPQVLPHLARDLAVAAAHAVGRAAGAQRELRHAERLPLVVGVRAAAADDRADVHAERLREAAERIGDLPRLVGVVARRDGRVRGEDRLRARRLEGILERRARGLRLLVRELERRERGMPLVEVHEAGLDAHRAQRAHAAHAEQDVLRQARVRVADVQPRGDPPGELVVLGPLGVEQVERDAAHVDAPDLRDDVDPADRDGHRERQAVVAGDERSGHAVGIGVDPVLVLPAPRVDALAEVALPVHEADGDHRDREVGRLLEDVAGQRAEPAGVDRQRGMDGELGTEVRGGTLGGDGAGDGVARQVLLHRLLEHGRAAEQPGVRGGAAAGLGADLLEEADRVAGDLLPAQRIERAEDLLAVWHPAPAVVVGKPRQRGEGLGDL
jgi:hypothetical protein